MYCSLLPQSKIKIKLQIVRFSLELVDNLTFQKTNIDRIIVDVFHLFPFVLFTVLFHNKVDNEAGMKALLEKLREICLLFQGSEWWLTRRSATIFAGRRAAWIDALKKKFLHDKSPVAY